MYSMKKQTIYTERSECAELTYIVFFKDGQYGLEIRMQKRTGTEIARFCAVTCSEETALRLQNLLWQNVVTPVTLRDVLEDFLS